MLCLRQTICRSFPPTQDWLTQGDYTASSHSLYWQKPSLHPLQRRLPWQPGQIVSAKGACMKIWRHGISWLSFSNEEIRFFTVINGIKKTEQLYNTAVDVLLILLKESQAFCDSLIPPSQNINQFVTWFFADIYFDFRKELHMFGVIYCQLTSTH